MRLTPWSRVVVDLLAQGPQPRRVVLAAAAEMVPPGYAARVHARTVRRRTDVENEAAIGARWVVIRNVSRMIITGSVIEFERDGERWWQLSAKARRNLTEKVVV